MAVVGNGIHATGGQYARCLAVDVWCATWRLLKKPYEYILQRQNLVAYSGVVRTLSCDPQFAAVLS